jgi:hypothetical protein
MSEQPRGLALESLPAKNVVSLGLEVFGFSSARPVFHAE